MKECLILFAKYPEIGKVKTRLAQALTEIQALELYKTMLSGTLDIIEKSGLESFVYCSPPGSSPNFNVLRGNIICRPQKGRGLGERMKKAFEEVFKEGYSRAVIVGGDIPGLSVAILRGAFERLKKGGAALGPAYDGGYYLVGFDKSAFLPEIFDAMPWGGRRVFADTFKLLKARGTKVSVLPRLRDVDTINDAIYYSKRDKPGSSRWCLPRLQEQTPAHL